MMLGDFHAFALALRSFAKIGQCQALCPTGGNSVGDDPAVPLAETLQLKPPRPIAKAAASKAFHIKFYGVFLDRCCFGKRAVADRRTHGVTLGCEQHESENERDKTKHPTSKF